MGTVVVKRGSRLPAPEIPDGELTIDPPPEIPQQTGGRWQQAMMALPMLGGTLASAMMMGRANPGDKTSYVVGGMFGLSSIAMLASSFASGSGQPKKAEMMAARREYLRHLATLRSRVRSTAMRQRAGLSYRHPDPAQLWSTVDSHRLWERRPADPDFGVTRIGTGPQTLATPLVPPVTRPLEELEPMTAGALRRFLDAYSIVPDLPVAVSLPAFARVYLRSDGSRPAADRDHRDLGDAHGLVRAILTQLAVFQAPDDLLIAICAPPHRLDTWDWVKWLPHSGHPGRVDALGAARLVAPTAADLEELLGDVIGNRPRFGGATTGPHVVVVLDGADLTGSAHLGTEGGLAGVTILDLDGVPPRLVDRSALSLEVTGAERRLHTLTADGAAEVGVADRIGVVQAEALARRLAPLRLSAATKSADAPLAGEKGLADLLGIADPEQFEVAQGWIPRPNRDKLRVPIGVGVDGSTVELDIKESAQDGMGPHGLLIGATGSGKSELLRTLVLSLALTHSSEELNFVLVDYKGGATFASLDRLPHTSAVITNLEGEALLVDRMADAINGEVIRRQELLRRAGNFANLKDYEKARAGGAPLAPLPSLFIVCDEFSEMLTAKPEFIEIFVQIGRVGRSIGIHLLLASQRLEEGRLRGLDTHLSYRIGLRTFSAMESRTVLGVPDAYDLPRAPGHGYLKFGTEPLVRLKAAYVSGSFAKAGGGAGRSGSIEIQNFGTHFVPLPERPAGAEPQVDWDVRPGESLLDVLVGRLAGKGPPAHQVWLPPLDDADTLEEALGKIVLHPQRGLTTANAELFGALQVPVAVVDKPAQQRRDVHWIHLAGAQGHVAIAGATQSGKSSLLRTIISGIALTNTPLEAQFYCLDFGGGTLGALRELPHVGGVAGRLDTAQVRRTVSEVAALLAQREVRFGELGVDSMASYRRRRAAGLADDDPYGDVFLVVDGWSTLRESYDDLEPVITDIATRGLSYGVHVIAASMRWRDFRAAIQDQFGTKLELRLGDPTDSICKNRRAAQSVRPLPGHGVTADGHYFLATRPELSSLGSDGSILAKHVAANWSGAPAPAVRMLPPVFAYDRLPVTGGEPLHIPVGLGEDLHPIALNFKDDQHFVVFGESECGKSTLLRGIATTLTRRFTPDEAKMLIIDHRRSLLGAIEGDHLLGYTTSFEQSVQYVTAVAGYMEQRKPPADVTPQQLRDRPWLAGRPECFVIVDDYEMVASGSGNPLDALLPYLEIARDVGLHVILARTATGAGGVGFQPLFQTMRRLGTPGLLMSGDRGESSPLGDVRFERMVPGRGRLVSRKQGNRLIQVADLPSL
ncbi:S-DNA-T family DNA segregation ATPase FtsK/SpoIIIE [Allocatelliglobosispora scoriae]|uniref:S-DNA-T family DNA segregation ATPase FtsK/SpoIIIE n=1 Tax=Allocatelliglobosispora scoriae TaxID=643052 RepID=A0A841BSM7_9ACTN|nr:type VII secretion protein EccCa [Allocatelliglobosispora scoriae]MBB5871234.1 S-DNA-T family DNA segregation ATPase FtsK/SpoIIIE [Allocatelliglobosispora scoriae]